MADHRNTHRQADIMDAHSMRSEVKPLERKTKKNGIDYAGATSSPIPAMWGVRVTSYRIGM
jgi:hypothetical protein